MFSKYFIVRQILLPPFQRVSSVHSSFSSNSTRVHDFTVLYQRTSIYFPIQTFWNPCSLHSNMQTNQNQHRRLPSEVRELACKELISVVMGLRLSAPRPMAMFVWSSNFYLLPSIPSRRSEQSLFVSPLAASISRAAPVLGCAPLQQRPPWVITERTAHHRPSDSFSRTFPITCSVIAEIKEWKKLEVPPFSYQDQIQSEMKNNWTCGLFCAIIFFSMNTFSRTACRNHLHAKNCFFARIWDQRIFQRNCCSSKNVPLWRKSRSLEKSAPFYRSK